MDKIFSNINSLKIKELINYAENLIVYSAPGMSMEIAGALLTIKDKFNSNNIHIIIDNDPNVIRYGYGEQESIEYLLDNGFNIRKEKGIRLGFICSDEIAYIYFPTPLSIEEEPDDESIPNAIKLDEITRGEILKRLIKNNLNDIPEIGHEELTNEDCKEIKEDIDSKPFVKPNLQRQMGVINSIFQTVELEFKGIKLKDHKFSLKAKELGIKDKNISDRITASYRLFGNVEFIEMEKLEKEYRSLKDEYLRPVEKVGNLLLNNKCKEFLEKLEIFKKKMKEVQNSLQEDIDKILSERKKELVDFIVSNINQLPKSEKEKIVSPKTLTEENLRNKIDWNITASFPDAKSLISKMELTVKIHNISDHSIQNPEFRKRIEEEFKKPFDDIIKIKNAVETKENKINFKTK